MEAKSATEIVMEVDDALMSGNKSLCMDDETEPLEDNEEGINSEPANTVDIVMKEIAEGDPVDVGQNNDKDGYTTERGNLISMENNVPVDKSGDTENLGSDKTSGLKKRLSTKKDKKKENINKTDDGTDKVPDVNKKVTKISKPTLRKTRKDAALSVEQDTVTIADNKNRKPTSSRSVQARILEAQKKIKIIADAADDDFENKNDKKDDDVTEMDTDTDANKETKKNKRPLSKTKKDPALSVKEVTKTKAVKKKGKTTSSRSVKVLDMEAQKENTEIPEDDQSTGNKQVHKSATEGSDKADSEPKWFILTGNSLQRKEFQQIIRQLKGRVCEVSHQWSYQATHFIVPDPIKRTEKLFAAAASGRWILKTDYLTASNQVGKFLAEEPYEWHENGLSEDSQIDLEAPRKWRLLKEKTGYGAFHGMRIVTYGECTAPSLDTLKRAVKAGDGTILATSPPYTRFLHKGIDFAVVSPGMSSVDIWVQWFLRCEIPCISANYLVEYVCKPGYPLDGHFQYGTNVFAERSYNNLKKRLDEEDDTGPRTPDSYDVACEVCGSHDRGEDMLICGDKSGSIGCAVGTHIDCCDPPLNDIPDDDWFCPKCTEAKNSMTKKSNKRKGK